MRHHMTLGDLRPARPLAGGLPVGQVDYDRMADRARRADDQRQVVTSGMRLLPLRRAPGRGARSRA